MKTTYLAISLVIVGLLVGSGHAVAQDSIVAAWLFDESGGNVVQDVSGNGHNGEIMGSVGRVAGVFGTALEISGTSTDYVEVPDHESLHLTDAITLMAWAKKDAPGATSCILGKDDLSGNRNYNLHINSAGFGKVYLSGTAATGEAVIADGQWHHVAGTWDGAVIKLYIDGVEAASNDFAGPIGTSEIPLKIGLLHEKYPFGGLIDEVAIFGSALTEAEVGSIMSNGLGPIAAAVNASDKLAVTWASIKK